MSCTCDYGPYNHHPDCDAAWDPVADIEAFHKKFGLEYTGKPRVLPMDIAEFRRKFLTEEVDEYKKASHAAQYRLAMLDGIQQQLFDDDDKNEERLKAHMAEMLDALIDEVYVALGTAYLQGFDVREAWRRVHKANMAKVRAESAADSKRGSKYDVVKPPGWEPPDLSDLVADHAHKEEP